MSTGRSRRGGQRNGTERKFRSFSERKSGVPRSGQIGPADTALEELDGSSSGGARLEELVWGQTGSRSEMGPEGERLAMGQGPPRSSGGPGRRGQKRAAGGRIAKRCPQNPVPSNKSAGNAAGNPLKFVRRRFFSYNCLGLPRFPEDLVVLRAVLQRDSTENAVRSFE